MQLDKDSGRVDKAIWLPSLNYDERAHAGFINAIIIHAISLPPDQYGGAYVEDFFCNQLDHTAHPYFLEIAKMRVSAHFYIKRSGKLVQFVATQHRAWHAGESCLNNLPDVNDFSVGVELEGCDEDGFSAQQYQILAELTSCLRTTYPAISKDNIVGHCHISPNRKTDPGAGFDWKTYKQTIC